jgi:uncharacterized protein (DUF1800 family)
MTQDTTLDDTVKTSDAPASQTNATATAPAIGLTVLAAAALAGCQSDGGDTAVSTGGERLSAAAAPTTATTDAAAVRFLNQASMGATADTITALRATGMTFSTWITNQMDTAKTPRSSLLDAVVASKDTYQRYELTARGSDGQFIAHRDHVFDAWWLNAVTKPDQLRQRVAFALSEIYVVSMVTLSDLPYCAASYYDMLSTNAFGSLKTLLKDVCTHPAMGVYLSHLTNHVPTPGTQEIPDQNFAREFLQLFTVGLYELNANGTPATVNSKPVETYSQADVEFLSHFFTGWSWNRAFAVDTAVKGYPFEQPYLPGDEKGPQIRHMLYDDSKHSKARTSGAKTFLNKAIPVTLDGVLEDPRLADGVKSTAKRDLDKLLTALITKHPNIAPFLARRMIQRLVTSNPSAQYVLDVATAFKASDTAGTGDMSLGVLVRSILQHAEARTATNTTTYGKLREPLLRITHMLRAFKGGTKNKDINGNALFRGCIDTGQASDSWGQASLGQSPLMSPSVFNYFRPDGLLPGKKVGDVGAYAPEFQITNESSVTGYLRHVYDVAYIGFAGGALTSEQYYPRKITVAGVAYPAFTPAQIAGQGITFGGVQLDMLDEFTAAYNDQKNATATVKPITMIEIINRKLFGGTMSTELKNHIRDQCFALAVSNTDYANLAPVLDRRTRLAVFLAMASSEYIVQK